MNIPMASIEEMQGWAADIIATRPVDYEIGGDEPYLRRWWMVPRNPWQNLHLHEILRSDDDRAGHDHPWANTSLVIEGGYWEAIYDAIRPWVLSETVWRGPGSVISRKATDTHRLILPEGGRAVSLFMTGPKEREWGFWCPDGKGWVHWRDFTGGANGEVVGAGCGEMFTPANGAAAVWLGGDAGDARGDLVTDECLCGCNSVDAL